MKEKEEDLSTLSRRVILMEDEVSHREIITTEDSATSSNITLYPWFFIIDL